MFLVHVVKRVLGRYNDFEGRAGRSEYWSWTVVVWAVTLVAAVLILIAALPTPTNSVLGVSVAITYALFALAVALPSLAVSVRRLHDTDHSGPFFLLTFLPVVNLYLLYLYCRKGDASNNRFGSEPEGVGS